MITMSQKEVGRLRVLEQVRHGALSQVEAANVLQISVRQLRRIQRRYETEGEAALVHRLRGHSSNHKLDETLVLRAQQLIASHYADFGPTLAAETLAERHGIALSVESVRTLMRAAGLWRAKRRRLKPIHPLRERRPRRGELIQIDGSPHDWFEGRAPRCTLLVFIDDATSELMALRFARAESTTDYLLTLRGYIVEHGLPMCLYSDRHTIFRSPCAQNPQTTYFARALERLGIEGIQASSPQAKGRVERANQTLQDRLIKAMRLADICDIEAANAWLPTYVKGHNRRFAVAPGEPEDAHVPYQGSPEELDFALAYHHERRLSKTLSCQFRQQIVQVHAPGQQRRLIGQQVRIIEHLDASLQLLHGRASLAFTTVHKKDYVKPAEDAKSINARVQQAVNKRPVPPAANHPWRRWEGPVPSPRVLPQTAP
ncbi:ISNCY family transposase [Castellaniella sp.]|uniref:ISNCY family transposase n=1 Tax=Castellaniella sp. TaxID=1955812 RepID=UPI003A93BBB1